MLGGSSFGSAPFAAAPLYVIGPVFTDRQQQYTYTLQDSNAQWYAAPNQHAQPAGYISPIKSQRQDQSQDSNLEWYILSNKTLLTTYLPVSVTPPRSQRIDPIPDLWQQWEAYNQVPYAAWYVPSTPPPKLPYQPWIEPPDFNWRWWQQHNNYPPYTPGQVVRIIAWTGRTGIEIVWTAETFRVLSWTGKTSIKIAW